MNIQRLFNSIDLIDEVIRLDESRQAQFQSRNPLSPTRILEYYYSNTRNTSSISQNNDDLEGGRQSNNYKLLRRKVIIRTIFCIIRLLFMSLCIYMDFSVEINIFLENLTEILLFHEGIVLINFIQMIFIEKTTSHLVNHNQNLVFQSSSSNSPSEFVYKIIESTDIIGNLLFFIWFLYGNYKFLYDREGIILSLQVNKFLTYYITFIILLGYFIYSRLIFAFLFIIIFSPCLLYMTIVKLTKKTRQMNVKDSLKEETFLNYLSSQGLTRNEALSLSCSICLYEFKENDKVSVLKCNKKHVFHLGCIRESVERFNFNCPLCRNPIDNEDEGEDGFSQSSFGSYEMIGV